MKKNNISASVEKIISESGNLIPRYMANPEDASIAQGNVAICIIDARGTVWGRLFGKNKIRARESFRVAWTKASQVWITGLKTGEFEKLAFAGQINEDDFGIIRPDYIGWEGGQPLTLNDGTKLSVGFSGFRGVSDLEIVVKAIKKAKL